MLFEGTTYEWSELTKCSQTKTFFSLPASHQIGKSSQAHIVLRADKAHNLASASSSVNVLSVCQVHNRHRVRTRPNLVSVVHILEHFEEGDIWHSIKDSSGRKERGKRSGGGKLLDITQHETRGQIPRRIMPMMTAFCCTSKLVTESPQMWRTLLNIFPFLWSPLCGGMSQKKHNPCFQS